MEKNRGTKCAWSDNNWKREDIRTAGAHDCTTAHAERIVMGFYSWLSKPNTLVKDGIEGYRRVASTDRNQDVKHCHPWTQTKPDVTLFDFSRRSSEQTSNPYTDTRSNNHGVKET
ncbi:hypothetical protein PoB_004836400 [Plakobranchus ocellatus]|uniref:Uncharacterized protein n=1 Tax=Plakobranchus ocellatus TaxID=259542 RepID=A0AAV4BP27_9GAST|nr:hypothetical protein PoB_004836400 [Plakobranchus ocellatus]